MARQLTSWIRLPVYPSCRFSNEKRTREVAYWRVGLHSSAPGGSGPNGKRITQFFLFLLMDSMKHGLSRSFYRVFHRHRTGVGEKIAVGKKIAVGDMSLFGVVAQIGHAGVHFS